jgi:hypothetical protein
VASAELFSGLGLVSLALVCLGAVAVQVVSALTVRSPRAKAPNGAAGESAELESTLVAVAQALTADLMSSHPAQQASDPDAQAPERAALPAESGSHDGRREDR